jgi:hypothetical protein
MASPLNTFRTITFEVGITQEIIYTAPLGFTAIVLMAQAANISSSTGEITFLHIGTTGTVTELVKNFAVPANDATSVITGKLVIEDGSSVAVKSGTENTFKITLSILESLNA